MSSAEESNTLRLELKAWERAFAIANHGRKAERSDIKKHPEVAKKYKIYNRLRSLLSNPSKSSSPSITSDKRSIATSQQPPSETPQKRQKSSDPLQPYLLDPYDAPRSAHQTPTHRKSLGPTPQKDGLVLGLFDLLSPDSNDTQTPSKKSRNFLGPVSLNAVVTPSKNFLKRQDGEASTSGRRRDCFRSPSSISRKSHPSSFLTPSVRRIYNTPSKRTPGSRGRKTKCALDETPAFLRRESQQAKMVETNNLNQGDLDYDAKAISWSPIKVRMPSKLAGKGLSALVQGLRDMENERLDEEMNLVHEMEMEGNESGLQRLKDSQVLIVDSQIPDMPLGADGENKDDSYDEDIEKQSRGRDGKPLRVWKKKGQKRTTRRVVIKPSKERWKPEPKWNGGRDTGEDEDSRDELAEEVVVAETQNLDTNISGDNRDDFLEINHDIDATENVLGVDFADSAANVRNEKKIVDPQIKGPKRKGGQKENGIGKSQQKEEDQAKGRPSKQKKAINATAHANFRALKIRNKNSRGKGRFGRRR